MAKQKIRRKELLDENDEFLTFSRKLLRTCIHYKVHALIALGGLLAVIILISGIRYYSEQAEVKAFAMLDEAAVAYNTALAEKDPDAALEQARPLFEGLMDDYGGKNASELGRIVYAAAAADAGKFQMAIDMYEAALGSVEIYPYLRPIVLSGLGKALESNGDVAGAIRQYERVVADQTGLMQAEAYFHLGRLYAESGRPQESADAFQKVAAEYPDSVYKDMAQARVAGE